MQIAMTSSTYTHHGVVVRDGDTIISMSSNDPWYRLFQAMADLFIGGQADLEAVSDMVSQYAHRVDALTSCPAAHHVLRSMTLIVDEPDCPHSPYRESPCDCPPYTEDDRRSRLRELIGMSP